MKIFFIILIIALFASELDACQDKGYSCNKFWKPCCDGYYCNQWRGDGQCSPNTPKEDTNSGGNSILDLYDALAKDGFICMPEICIGDGEKVQHQGHHNYYHKI